MAESKIDQAIELAKQGRKAEARQIMTSIIRQERDNPVAWVVLAQVVGDRDKAIDCLKQVLRLEPDHPWARLHLARLTGSEKAAPVEAKAVGVEPTKVDDPTPTPPEDVQPVTELEEPALPAKTPEMPRAPSPPETALEETTPASLPRAPREPEIMAADDSLPEIDLTPIGDLEGKEEPPNDSLDPLAGTGQWRAPTEEDLNAIGIPSLDNLRAEAGSATAAMPRSRQGGTAQTSGRRRSRWLLLVVVFVIFVALGAVLAWAALNGLLDGIIPPGLLP